MLSVTVGPMFSKKTSWLMDRLNDHIVTKHKILYINSEKDVRNETFSTHNSLLNTKYNKIDLTKASNLLDINVERYDVIGIDEGQWFPDIYPAVLKWIELGKIIYCVGLDGDFNMHSIGNIYQLLPISDYFHKNIAICNVCAIKGINTNAPFSKYIGEEEVNSNYAPDNGSNYIATCRNHH